MAFAFWNGVCNGGGSVWDYFLPRRKASQPFDDKLAVWTVTVVDLCSCAVQQLYSHARCLDICGTNRFELIHCYSWHRNTFSYFACEFLYNLQNAAVVTMRYQTTKLLTTAAIGISLCLELLIGTAGAFDKSSQIGPNPVLPEPQAYLVPSTHEAKAIGWKDGETPSVPDGYKIEAIAKNLEHPRQPYVLPNGDILVVEANGPGFEHVERPKDLIMGLLQKSAGASVSSANRITILHERPGSGGFEKSVFLDGLFSPFGVVLVGSDLYVANTDAILKFHYNTGDLKITGLGEKVIDLPGGPIDHHWTKSLTASPDGSKLYVGVGSNSNIMEKGAGVEVDRAAIWEVD
ncbi:MAG: hypothetical protein M3O03_11285, partial [Pseudomonadota bacterium]|nr:hypothetical protein [Pseudomonadota bacterium]